MTNLTTKQKKAKERMKKVVEVKQITTVATDILVCLMSDGSLYSTKLKGRDKNKWTAVKVPNAKLEKSL